MDITTESFDQAVARLQAALGGKKPPSIRELIEKTQDSEFRKNLTDLVAPMRASHASGRYPTVAQVRKMLVANDNISPDTIDYSQATAEYTAIFDRCLTESGDVNSLLKRLAREFRVNGQALAMITNSLTGSAFSKLSFSDAKSAIMDEFANRGVAMIAKKAAGDSKPF